MMVLLFAGMGFPADMERRYRLYLIFFIKRGYLYKEKIWNSRNFY